MAISITFYNYSGEPNRLDKTSNWALVKEISGTFQMPESITDPIIEIYENIEDDGGKVLSANYMYIPVLKRYYFITNIEAVRTNVWRVYGHVDVLMSFKNQIKNLEGVLERAENDYNAYLVDNKVNQYQYDRTCAYTFTVDGEDYKFDYSNGLYNLVIVG